MLVQELKERRCFTPAICAAAEIETYCPALGCAPNPILSNSIMS